MSQIVNYFLNSELAFAVYADLVPGVDPIPALTDSDVGMSQKQAEAFATKWRVAAQHTDASNGLSATVFEEVATGQRYLAVRGTEGFSDPKDLWTDFIDIAVLGTPERQDQYAALRDQVAAWLSDGTLSPGFTVTGHSLGGFLSGALLVDYPTEISHAYLYNAPGVGGLSAGLRLLAGLEVGPDLDLSKVSNLVAQAGFSLVAGLGLDWSTPVPIFIEDQTLSLVGNHSIVTLTDALSVYDLLDRLDPGLTVDQITTVLGQASSRANDTLEIVVNALGDLVGAGATVSVDDRDQLYARIQAIQSNALYQQASGLVSVVPVASLSSFASLDTPEGLAYRYALEHLNPFAITGDAGLYTVHNGGGVLNSDQFTGQYLQDRAYFLEKVLLRNAGDVGFVRGTGELFQDAATGLVTTADVGALGLPFDEAVQYKFGTEVGETISGGKRADHLYGRAGDDILEGKRGNDYLEGGSGDDRYIFNIGDGVDTILDVEANDRILLGSVNGNALGGTIDSVPNQTNVYEDSDHNRYTVSGADLQITLFDGTQLDTNSNIRIKNFTDGMFGIHLNLVAAPTTPQAPTGTQVFDLGYPVETRYVISPSVNGPTNPVYGPGWDPYLTEVINAQGATGPMFNSTGNVITGQVAGGLGDSYIQGDAGFNYLIDDLWYSAGSLAGTPAEWLSGDPVYEPLLQSGIFFSLGQGAGNDVMRGGAGNDWLESHGGDDWLYGDDGNDLLLDDPGLEFGDNRWLALPGSGSDDYLSGGNGNDVLITLQGKDTLDGGEGDDHYICNAGEGADVVQERDKTGKIEFDGAVVTGGSRSTGKLWVCRRRRPGARVNRNWNTSREAA